jgi:hypothetical protein
MIGAVLGVPLCLVAMEEVGGDPPRILAIVATKPHPNPGA